MNTENFSKKIDSIKAASAATMLTNFMFQCFHDNRKLMFSFNEV